MIGKSLAHCEITASLGKGGMGEVWRARDGKLGREVAIKTLPEEFAKDADTSGQPSPSLKSTLESGLVLLSQRAPALTNHASFPAERVWVRFPVDYSLPYISHATFHAQSSGYLSPG